MPVETCGGEAHYWDALVADDGRPKGDQHCHCGAWTWAAWERRALPIRPQVARWAEIHRGHCQLFRDPLDPIPDHDIKIRGITEITHVMSREREFICSACGAHSPVEA